ncbi:MAG: RsmD family RNA methyltransferase [Sutterellaceae bacterium]|nr:RsmD family RNA methyltransferase [Sutterellaceae bacterium]MDD7442446.1 RsmD family RNA methyltransferase [Sutterellaceae bacterium]MDY2868907.1 RsmD family RNA methyltransferase [Mesosutterella sp.]
MKKRKNSNPASLATCGRKSGIVRISSGRWKRTPLPVIDLDGLRPTGNRVRETVFDWLNFLLSGFEGRSSLDMFAGSGALGLEFASRGGHALLIEKNPGNARSLRQVVGKLRGEESVSVRCGDALSLLGGESGRFDVIFIDPPFASGLFGEALSLASRLLLPEGIVYLENPVEEEVEVPASFTVIRSGKAGAVRFRLLARAGSALSGARKEEP